MIARPELVERATAGLEHSPVTGYPMDEKIECVSLAQLSQIRETLQ